MKLDLGNLRPRHRSKKSANGSKRTRRSSQTLTFVFFVGLAFFFWVLQRMQGDLVRTLSIRVLTDSLSVGNQTADSLPQILEVDVQDKGFEHLRYTFGDFEPIQLRLYRGAHGGSYIGIDKKELTAELSDRLSSSAVIVRQSFSELSYRIMPRSSKSIPVHLSAIPNAGMGYTTASTRFTPDSIVVYGNRQQLDTISAIYLPNDYDGLVESRSAYIQLNLPGGVHSDTKQIRLDIEVEQLTEQSFTLPIVIHNVPEGYKLIPLPSTATVLLTIPRSKYSELNDADIELTAQYTPAEDWEREQGTSSRTLEVQLTKAPSWVKRYSIKPERIQFVLQH